MLKQRIAVMLDFEAMIDCKHSILSSNKFIIKEETKKSIKDMKNAFK